MSTAASVDELVAAAMRGASGQVMHATELAARLRVRVVPGDVLDRVLGAMERRGDVVVLDPPSPDPHLDGNDRRIVSMVDTTDELGAARARERAQAAWQQFLRGYLATHRCG